ncbi:MAG: GNAT family N-acetyltransferase [Gammaproteobacteria bacterium]
MTLFWAFQNKTNLDISVEWNPLLNERTKKKIIFIHVESFLDAYKHLTEKQLGLAEGLTKKSWLTNMIKDELAELKEGSIPYAGVYINDEIVGFVSCDPAKPRYNLNETIKNDTFKHDVYIRLLAVKPSKYLFPHYDSSIKITHPDAIQEKVADARLPENIRTGLGRHLMESVEKKFDNCNALTLDTRLINTGGRKFYESIGFKFENSKTYSDVNPTHYVGYEKETSHKFKI